MDIFYEYYFKKEKNKAVILKIAGLTLAAILMTLIFALIFLLGLDVFRLCIFLIIMTWWGYVLLLKNFNTEYEFAITNHELDIDIIKGKKTRRHITTINLKKCDFFGNLNHPDTITAMKDSGTPSKEYWFVKSKKSENIFVTDVISRKNKAKIRVYIEPDKTLAEYIRLANPKAFKGEFIERD